MHPILFLGGVSPGQYPRNGLLPITSHDHLAAFEGLQVLGIFHGLLYGHNLQKDTSNNGPEIRNFGE